MPRDIPVGNGSFLITFDRDYCLRDIYYPFAGMENHSDGYKFRFGLWIDGEFGWIDRKWELKLEYQDESLLTRVTALNETVRVHLDSQDLIDYRENIFLRRIIIRNLAETEREARLFFHHDFRILETARGDTAYYDPDEKAIIHYKKNRYFLMSGIRENAHGIDQFATGRKEFQGLEGTWRDAEDGRLEGNPISQGSVDSTLGISVALPPHNDKTVYYWICAGNSFEEVDRLNRIILGHGPEYIARRTTNYWKAWLNKSELILPDLPPEILDLFKKSLLILRTNINSNGAIIAGNDSDVYGFARDTYGYMWPRDGALTAYALDLAGYFDITSRFFEFCCRIIGRGKEIVGYFLHKYNPDGSLGSSWHPWIINGKKQVPIQEDSTGLVLWAFWSHFNKLRDVEFTIGQYENLVIRCGDFLASYRDEKTGLPLPSYDLWEERWGIHTFTVAAVYAGLKAAESFAVFFNDRRRRLIYGRASEEIKAAADQYLFDHFLADSVWTFDRFDLSRLAYTDYRLRGEEFGKLPEYNRHAYTDTGVTPLGVPGDSKHLVVTDSDEHGEEGHIIEDAGIRVKMVEKRLLKKLPLIRDEISPPVLYGDDNPDILITGWGSTYGVIKEVVDILSKNRSVALLHFAEVHPFPLISRFDYVKKLLLTS